MQPFSPSLNASAPTKKRDWWGKATVKVMTDQSLSYRSRVLYAVISAHVPKAQNVANVGFRRLAALLGVSAGTIFSWAKELEKAKYIEKQASVPGKRGAFLLTSSAFPQPEREKMAAVSSGCGRCHAVKQLRGNGFCAQCSAEIDKERAVKEALVALQSSGVPITTSGVIAYLRDRKDERKFNKAMRRLGVKAA